MTIAEAVRLILEAAASSASGETYVLDMGEPIKIMDLATDVARLAGADPETVRFTYMGLRPGERLHETLFYDAERSERTAHEGILRARPSADLPDAADLHGVVDALIEAVRDQDDTEARRLLLASVAPRAPEPAHDDVPA